MKTFITCMMAAFLMTSCMVNGESLTKAINAAIESIETEGPKDSVDYELDGFASLKFDAVGAIVYTQGEACSLRAIGDSSLIAKTNVEVKDGKLLIYLKNGNNQHSSSVKFYVTSPALYDIEINGVGAFKCDQAIDIDGDVNVNIDGVGAIEFKDFSCNNLKFAHKGVGAAELNVKCENFEFLNDGVGAAELDVDVDSLSVNSQGVGAVVVKGKTHSYQKKTGGVTSKVEDKDLKVE